MRIPDNLEERLEQSLKLLQSAGIEPKRCDPRIPHTKTTKDERLAHIAWLCVKGSELAVAGQRDQALRCLYFADGALWSLSDFEEHPLKPEEAERADTQ
jgi:hypothetical protein